jgi:1,4-alpha-glucan branching enzyme
METRHADATTLSDRSAARKSSSTTTTQAAPSRPSPRDATNGGAQAQTRQQSEDKTQVEFRINAEGARSVCVAGTFNNWDPSKTPLRRNGNAWQTKIALPKGRHEYRFVVDGKWMIDPAAQDSAPNPYGERNSVVSV